jgi:mono/diheme cytochrome c family protein
MATLAVLGLLAPAAGAEPAATLAELVQRHDPSSCEACHDTIHKEWRGSFHARSIVQTLGSLRAYIDAVEKDRKLAPDKVQMLKCLDCHAPMVNDASEGAVREIVALVKTATGGGDEAARKAAVARLAGLSVNCTGCHTVKGTGNPMQAPEPGVSYGPTGAPGPHPTRVSPAMGSSVMCSQCHALWYARDGEYLYCTTIFESHQNAYRSAGGTQSCQDCHMKARGHTFPGAHDQTLVKQGLSLALEAIGYRHITAGKLVPRAVVTVDVTNLAGHRVPDG